MFVPPSLLCLRTLKQQLHHHLLVPQANEPLYERLCRTRSWFNALNLGFELYLEDEWNDPVEGETRLELRLRSLATLNDYGTLAYDCYTNHRSPKGVWHLGNYQHSQLVIDSVEPLILFIKNDLNHQGRRFNE
jgi:hypothetical protein